VDDAAPRGLALRQILFFVWATFAEHKLVILGERRSRDGYLRGSIHFRRSPGGPR